LIPGFADHAALTIRMKYGIPVSVNPVRGFFLALGEGRESAKKFHASIVKTPAQGKEVERFRRPATVIPTKTACMSLSLKGWEDAVSRRTESQ